MSHVISKDSTRIAYDRRGRGPAVIIVNGAMGYRGLYGDESLANTLSTDLTVYLYDRRGRGESADTKPYTVEREIEDIEALIHEAGGSACLYGVSSGAALALLAAAKLGAAGYQNWRSMNRRMVPPLKKINMILQCSGSN